MTGISAIQANTHASTTSLAASVRLIPSHPATTSPANAAANTEDSVHLSDSAREYLQSSSHQQQQTTNPGTTVEQLVKAAAAGDSGALSLLEVV